MAGICVEKVESAIGGAVFIELSMEWGRNSSFGLGE